MCYHTRDRPRARLVGARKWALGGSLARDFTVNVLVLVCICLGTSVSAASKPVGGCTFLQTEATVTCMAKVSCAGETSAITAAEALFDTCDAGRDIAVSQVQDMIAQFQDQVFFRCCIGNARGGQMNLGTN